MAAFALHLTLLCLALPLVGCDLGGGPDGEVPPMPEADSEDPPILPAAPWFDVPADWQEQHPSLSPNAQVEAHFLLMAERQASVHPGDGEGRAWIERVDPVDPATPAWTAWRRGETSAGRPRVPAATRHRFELTYEAGPHGIEVGGRLFLSAEAFWDWSTAQTLDPDAPGYVTAEVTTGRALLSPDPSGTGFVVEGAPLREGDRVRFVYGAGRAGAQVDRYAERDAAIPLAVDADGDGFRRWIENPPRLDVLPRTARLLVARAPAELAPDEDLVVSLALVDGQGNRTSSLDDREPPDGTGPANASVEIRSLTESPIALSGPQIVPIAEWLDGTAKIELAPLQTEGVLRLAIEGRGALAGLDAKVPPIVLRSASRRLVWADLHGHTRLSDGTGRPDDYFRYARDVAGLDVAALTDHDHWGPVPLDEDPDAIRAMFETTDAAESAGRFVTIPGYEWTSWLHGHRHVLYFDPVGAEERPRIFSAIDPETDRPDELWDALRSRNALTFAHHSAGDPVAVNWRFRPDPELEPITEIASVHGQSESPEMPAPVGGAIPGWFVLDTLRAGFRFGFVGSGDSHDGHPGLTEIAGGHGGLAGLYVDRLDRSSVRDALRRRHTFATNGIRPFFEVSIDDVFMGGTLTPSPDDEHRLRIRYEATAPIERIELVRSGRVASIEPSDPLSIDLERRIPALQDGEFHYVRIRQKNGGNAWSSPIYVGSTGSPPPADADSGRPASP